jgi:quercetin dioxygenase-like cupin family protein
MAGRYRSLLGWKEGAKRVHVHLTAFKTAGPPGYQHSHAAEEAVYIIEGEATYTFGGRKHRASPGKLIFFHAGVEHAQVKYLSPTMKYLVVRSVEKGDEPCCCGGDRPARARKPGAAKRRSL